MEVLGDVVVELLAEDPSEFFRLKYRGVNINLLIIGVLRAIAHTEGRGGGSRRPLSHSFYEGLKNYNTLMFIQIFFRSVKNQIIKVRCPCK